MATAPMHETAKPIVRYFHGGNCGLKVGDYILPPLKTGRKSVSDFGAGPVHQKDSVYISVSQTDAQLFASANREPVVHEVEPEGDHSSDPDCTSGVSFTCSRAKVIAVYKMSGKNIKKARIALIAGSHRPGHETQSK